MPLTEEEQLPKEGEEEPMSQEEQEDSAFKEEQREEPMSQEEEASPTNMDLPMSQDRGADTNIDNNTVQLYSGVHCKFFVFFF